MPSTMYGLFLHILSFFWLLLIFVLQQTLSYQNDEISFSKSTVRSFDGDKMDTIDEIYWEEERPPPHMLYQKTPITFDWDVESKPKRPFLSWKSMKYLQPLCNTKQTMKQKTHPLRTNLWRIRIRYRKQRQQQQECDEWPFARIILVEFHPSGYCRVTNDKSDTEELKNIEPIFLGTWNVIPSGVLWKLPTREFWAEVHLQPFAKYPRMLRGVIVDKTNPRYVQYNNGPT
jgi:hypothetical protein